MRMTPKLVKQLGKVFVFSTLSNYSTQNHLVFLPVSIGVIQIKSSAVVKIDERDFERIPTLTDREMLRILDARSEDIG